MKKIVDNNKFVLITGATGGLGNAFCKEIIKEHRNIILSGTRQAKLDSLKNELLALESSLNIQTFPCDLSDQKQVEKFLEFIDEKELQIGLLINNAGCIIEGSIKHSDIDTLMKCIEVNAMGTIHLTKGILDRFPNNIDIITISSLAGNYPLPYMATYSATKALLKTFFLALRYEYKKNNIRALLVQPGAIATSYDMKKAIEAQGLKGRMSSVAPDIIAKKSLRQLKKNKAIYIPGFFNKLTNLASKLTPLSLQIKVAGKMWQKSQEKRNIK